MDTNMEVALEPDTLKVVLFFAHEDSLLHLRWTEGDEYYSYIDQKGDLYHFPCKDDPHIAFSEMSFHLWNIIHPENEKVIEDDK